MIFVRDDLLNPEILNPCLSWLGKASWSYGWPSNRDMPYGHWNVDIAKGGRHNTSDVEPNLPPEFKAVWDTLRAELFKGTALLVRCYSNRHTFGTEGYIHTDSEMNNSATCIIYMDREWKTDWGGETSFYNQDKTEIIKSVLPKFGRVVVFPGNINHCARAIARICPKVRTTLMFKVLVNPKELYGIVTILSDFLDQVGANKKKHKHGTLKDHLMRVFYLLKSAGLDDGIAVAGGLHSVYGTNAFKDACLPWDSPALAELFGQPIDRMVRIFSSINRPSVLENPDGTLNETDLLILRCIECANLYDQDELTEERFPNLYKFATQFQQRINHGN